MISLVFGAFWLQEQSNSRRKKILEFNIELKTRELKLSNDHMLSSITYAKRIQDAIIPEISNNENNNFEYFTYEKPKDIVGGDFVWFRALDSIQAIAVCDCTGHGVPGGFMTILSVDMLNSVFVNNEINSPKDVLYNLDLTVKKRLYENTEGSINDGLDMGMLLVDSNNNKVTYAGANRPIVVKYTNGDLKLHKGSRKSIGDIYSKNEYKDIVLNIDQVDSLYVYSDGIVDQFGGPNEKKFTTKRLMSLLTEICEYPLEKQKTILDETISDWASTADFQTDDISFLCLDFRKQKKINV